MLGREGGGRVHGVKRESNFGSFPPRKHETRRDMPWVDLNSVGDHMIDYL